jgi:ABC-type multidrug transport system fused ATPase/permease subunit
MRAVRKLDPHAARTGATLTGLGALSGVVEAAAVVLFVRAALAAARRSGDSNAALGFGLTASPPALLAVAAALTAIAAAIHVGLARGSARFALTVVANARNQLIEGYAHASWSYQAGMREGALQHAISQQSSKASRAAETLVAGAATLALFVALAASALLVAPLVSATMYLALLPVVLILRPLVNAARPHSVGEDDERLHLAQAVAAATSLAREIATFGVREEQAAALREQNHAGAPSFLVTRTTNTLSSLLFRDLALFAFIVVIALLYMVADLRTGATAAGLLLVTRSLGYAQSTYNLVQSGGTDATAIATVVEKIEELERAAEDPGSVPVTSIEKLTVDCVSFAHRPNRHTLQHVSFGIRRGEAIGIVGESGAGKTTLAELLIGLREPTCGFIRVDDLDLREVRQCDWRRLSAFVPQDPQLAAASIAENIRFLRSNITDDEVVCAAKRAHIHDEIVHTLGGYQRQLGPRSTGVSSGQRQRIAIARSLAGDPEFLVLDEPTSALDHRSEGAIQQTLDELRGRVTMVVIAHRSATLELCDQILEVTGRRVRRIR